MTNNNFTGKWQTERKEPVSEKIKNSVAPQVDLKKRLVDTERALGSQIAKLDRTIVKMNEKEKSLFSRTSAAFQRHDTVQANAYANELTELRKAIKLVNGAKLSLESVQVRLKTITDIGDLAVTLVPVGQVVRTVRKTLMSVMPSANESIGEINSGLEGLMQEIGNIPTMMGLNFDTTSEETEKILAEASVIAESKVGSKFPTLPDAAMSDVSSDTSI